MVDVFEEEGEAEQTVSIQEYLKGVEEQELEADLVLGGDEGKECTYEQGYMKRQAIFSCLTCTPNGNAGVCTACSLSCHDGHEILELWTKRNFRCDCGNSKFGEIFCKLFPNKDISNAENSYNHNFKGSYCNCGRPYPDPEAEEQEEMIQCCICEDWFHEDHIGLVPPDEIPRDEEVEPLYEDFICGECATAFSFLTMYPDVILNDGKQNDVLGDVSSACGDVAKVENDTSCSLPKTEDIKSISTPETVSKKPATSNQCKEEPPSSGGCVLGLDLALESSVSEKRYPMFLSKNWRDLLCRCDKCMAYYSQKHIDFLLDREDSIAEYEKMATLKREEKLQRQEGVELNFLNKLGHVEKMEILNGIADMKDEIHSFLESFDSSKPITSADVHQVFENLAKKRRRV